MVAGLAPIGRTTISGEYPAVLHGTWVESEAFTYPAGGFTRRAFVELRRNEHNPIELPYGQRRVVRCAVADTFFSIPARLVYKGKTVKGFISVQGDGDERRFTFTPEAAATGEGGR